MCLKSNLFQTPQCFLAGWSSIEHFVLHFYELDNRLESDFHPSKVVHSSVARQAKTFLGAFKSDAELFSVSGLSSLTETKRLSFFLTPPNSLKCHRSVLSWCRTEQQFKTRQCYLSRAAIYSIHLIGSGGSWRCVSCVIALQRFPSRP